MHLITTKLHGVLDYMTVGMLVALPRALRWPTTLKTLMTGMAVSVFGYSLLTRYELGLFRRLPMPTHLRLDFFSAVMTLALALMFRTRSRTAGPVLLGMGLFELGASMMTDPVPFRDQDNIDLQAYLSPERAPQREQAR